MDTRKSAKRGWTFKELLFSYLAITKVFYWANTLGAMEGWGEFGSVIVNRLIGQDIMAIVILIAMFTLDDYITRRDGKTLAATIKLYAVGLVIFLALILAYHLLLGLFITVNINDWPRFFLEWTMVYAICTTALTLKEKLKKKEAEQYIPDANTDEGKIALLETLCNAGVLTRDECNEKIMACGGTRQSEKAAE
jgi:hypothetical protein